MFNISIKHSSSSKYKGYKFVVIAVCKFILQRKLQVHYLWKIGD